MSLSRYSKSSIRFSKPSFFNRVSVKETSPALHILAGGSPTISISVVSQYSYISILWLPPRFNFLVTYFNISFYFIFFIIHLFYFIFILFFLSFSLLISYKKMKTLQCVHVIISICRRRRTIIVRLLSTGRSCPLILSSSEEN